MTAIQALPCPATAVLLQVRRAVVGHLMLRLAGAWDEQPAQQQPGSSPGEGPSSGGQEAGAAGAANGASSSGCGSSGCGSSSSGGGGGSSSGGSVRGGITSTLHLLRRAMDPSCDLEALILDCAVGRGAAERAAELLCRAFA